MTKRSGFWAPILVLLLAAGATLGVALSSSSGNDPAETQLATEGASASQAGDEAVDAGADGGVDDHSERATGTVAEAVRVETVSEPAEATGPVWLVPWREGFVEIAVSYPEPTLPEGMSDDFPGLFPQEVLDLFNDGEEVTVSEAQERLTQAGLLESVEEILGANPDALEAIYDNQAPPTFHAAISTDGVIWEPLELDAPVESDHISSVASNGTHLVLATNAFDTDTPQSAVATTDDLKSWTVYDITPAPAQGLPEFVRSESSLQQVLVNDNGWLATQMNHSYVDIEALIGLETAEDAGWGWNTTETGLTVEIYPAVESIFDDGDSTIGDSPPVSTEVETREYTWEELGVDPAMAKLFEDGPPETVAVWAGAWGAEPTQTTLPGVGWVQGAGATEDAFFLPMNSETGPGSTLLRSSNGTAWSEVPLPSEYGIETITGIEGGLLTRVYDNDGLQTLVSSDDGATWHMVTIPALPNPAGGGFAESSSTGAGFVAVVDAQLPGPEIDIEPGPATYQYEGFEVTSHWNEAGWSLTIVDIETGETVLDEYLENPTEDEITAAEEAGELDDLWEEPSWVSYTDESTVTYVQPDTGEVIVAVPHEVEGRAHEQAWRSAMEAAGLDPDAEIEWTPDLYLIATRDGEEWLVEQLPTDSEPWPALAAINGDKVAVNIRGQRTLFEFS